MKACQGSTNGNSGIFNEEICIYEKEILLKIFTIYTVVATLVLVIVVTTGEVMCHQHLVSGYFTFKKDLLFGLMHR